MSHNQSRGDKIEPPQYRRSGNPAPQRNFFGGVGGGGMGGGSNAPPSSSSSRMVPALDEQKRDQARHACLRGPTSTFPTPIVPKQQLPKQDAGTVDQSNITEPHPIPKAKRDVHVTAPPAVAQTQKLSGHPIQGISMPMPFHQSQLPMQYGGPNPQMQSQAMVNSSMPIPISIPLPMGNPPQVQPQVFVPGIQHHPLQPQGIMHQAQSLNFSSQMGPSLAPQLGNMGMGLGPQYHQQQQQQQAGKYGGAHKTVKITPPDTHEELRLDRNDAYGDSGPSVPRSRPSMPPPQSQPIPTYPPAHPMNFYPNSYNASPIYFPSPGSVTLTSPQIPPSSQAPRFNQVTIKPASSLHGEKVGDSPLLNRAKSTTARGKKKEILQKADAQGNTADLYNAYKGPEETRDALTSTESTESSSITLKQVSADVSEGELSINDKPVPNKPEPDDWEDAADISTPKLETPLGLKLPGEDESEGMTKKYSRDFLLKFSKQCNELPGGFEITSDIEAFIASNVNIHRESPLLNRAKRTTARGKKKKKEMLQKAAAQGTTADLYNAYKGPEEKRDALTSTESTESPLQAMHKAEKKYEVGKITDEEQAKQRQLKGILNKLTPQNFEKLFEQVKQVNIDNAGTLSGVIDQIFDKALMEPTFCEMYANFCLDLAGELPDFSEDNEKITFKRLLLNKCQEEFERGVKEQEEANRVEEEGEVKQTEEQREEKRIQVRRRMLGNIRLIGELYKKRMLTERVMHAYIQKLLGEYQNPDEEDIEALCKLMSTIGEMIDHPKACSNPTGAVIVESSSDSGNKIGDAAVEMVEETSCDDEEISSTFVDKVGTSLADIQNEQKEDNQLVVVDEKEKDIIDYRRKGIAGVESAFGTKVVTAEFVPLSAGDGETWRGFHVGQENAERLRGLQKNIPDFFSNVCCASSKRVVHNLGLLASNLVYFENGQLNQMEAEMLRMMKDEFKDLERDGFLVDWAFEEIDRALKFPIEQEMNLLAEMERGLEKEVTKLRTTVVGFKDEIEDCKSRIAVCNQQLIFAEEELHEKEVELNRLRSELELRSRMLLDA